MVTTSAAIQQVCSLFHSLSVSLSARLLRKLGVDIDNFSRVVGHGLVIFMVKYCTWLGIADRRNH